MDVKVINPFLQATLDVIGTMAQIAINPGKPYVKKERKAQGDVTGVIGIMGKNKGTISVTFAAEAALAIVSNMLGEKITELNDEITDAVGEMTNMISGQARRGLAEIGIKYDGAIPSVIMGKNHTISHISNKPILAIPFTTDFGDITVEICFG